MIFYVFKTFLVQQKGTEGDPERNQSLPSVRKIRWCLCIDWLSEVQIKAYITFYMQHTTHTHTHTHTQTYTYIVQSLGFMLYHIWNLKLTKVRQFEIMVARGILTLLHISIFKMKVNTIIKSTTCNQKG